MNTGSKFLLIALDPQKRILHSSSRTFVNYALAGSILMDLTLLGRGTIKEKYFYVEDSTPTKNVILDEALQIIHRSSKFRKPQYWVTKLTTEIKKLDQRFFNELENGEHIKIKREKKFFFTKTFYDLQKTNEREELINKVKKILLEDHKVDDEMAVLIGLVSASNLIPALFEKKQQKLARKKAKEIMKNNQISKAVSDTIQGIQAALIATTTSAGVR